MNVSIVGINQLTDIAIDRVNKPTLPLASGEMTPAAGVAICVACTVAALAIGESHDALTVLFLPAVDLSGHGR